MVTRVAPIPHPTISMSIFVHVWSAVYACTEKYLIIIMKTAFLSLFPYSHLSLLQSLHTKAQSGLATVLTSRSFSLPPPLYFLFPLAFFIPLPLPVFLRIQSAVFSYDAAHHKESNRIHY